MEAILGDAVLKLLLVMHYPRPRECSGNAGPLNDFIVRHSTNDFLYHRHLELAAADNLPEGLLPPRGLASADPMCFEAWIGRVFTRNGGDLHATADVVLPALGVSLTANA